MLSSGLTPWSPHAAHSASSPGHPSTADLVAAWFMGALVVVLVVGLPVYASRWRRVRHAKTRWEAIELAFGKAGARRIMIGWGVLMVAMLGLLFYVGASDG